MGFLEILDNSAILNNCVVFSSVYEKVKGVLFENNVVMITGYLDDKESFIIGNIQQA